jgi:hypothetical protein
MNQQPKMLTMKTLITFLTIISAAATSSGGQQAVGEWQFTEQAEVIRDKSGNANDLRVEGCQWAQSKLGQALHVPANSGRVWRESPGAALRPGQSLGIVAWVRPLGTGEYCAVVRHGKGWGEEGTAGYRLLVYLDGVRFLLKAGRVINISGGKIIRGQWNQVAATYDGKEAVAFINGQPVVRDLVEGPIVYTGIDNIFEVGSAEGRTLDGEIASLKVFDRALSPAEVAADFEAGKNIRLTPEEITAERYAKLEKCALTVLPAAPFVRDRHTTLLAHMDNEDHSDADYSRWEGRAGGWRLKRGVPGRFGLGVQLPSENNAESGAPILYRGGSNCDMQRGTCEFWMRAPEAMDPLADDKDRYLLTIIPEFHLGYGKRPGVHLVMRTHAATRSLQFVANTDRINWYSHLNGAWIADSAKTALHMPLSALAGSGWHHVLCSWNMEDEGRIWLLVDGKGVTTTLAKAPEPGRQIPCYKIFLGGSYFPEVYCPSAKGTLDEFRLTDQTVAGRLEGYQAPPAPRVQINEQLMMQSEDLCRHFLDFTAHLQMGGGWEGVYTWPNLMPDESPGSYAAAAEDDYTMRHVTPAFLRACEVLGDDRYLRVAENCGQMLVKTQDKNGAWCQGYIIMPDQAYPVSPGTGSIEEGTQTDPLRVLFWLWRITGKPEYRDAAIRSAQFVLGGQKPDGAWPLTVNSHTMKPGGGYSGYSTLNDGTTLWGMKAMLMGWHLTQEQKYLDALRKAGQWLINAQLPGKARGWAEQYRDDGKPAWAREFEPPAACMSAIGEAADALFLIYDLTGDEQYLAPLRKCAEWGLNMPAEHKGYLYYDPETGEPVTAKGYKIFRFSEPAFKSATPYRTSADYFNRLQAQIKSRSNGPLLPGRLGPIPHRDFEKRTMDKESVAASLDSAQSATETPIAHLTNFKRGKFPAGNTLNEHPRHGRHFWPGRGAPDVQRVLDYLQLAKVAAGELDAAAVPRYADDYFGFIDPARDWYKTPLLREAP